jgi:hypothetical protein
MHTETAICSHGCGTQHSVAAVTLCAVLLAQAFVQRQGWDYVRLDGSTPQKLRQGICDEFNNRPSIFLLLLSTVAGGLGLNLTAANKVVRGGGQLAAE